MIQGVMIALVLICLVGFFIVGVSLNETYKLQRQMWQDLRYLANAKREQRRDPQSGRRFKA